MRSWLCCVLVLVTSGCSIGRRNTLPDAPPPLLDLEEPLELRDEPDDEVARQALPPGSFTGVYVESPARSLDALASGSEGLEVARVVENSPADLAGLRVGDRIVEVRVAGRTVVPQWPSAWRDLEIETPPGTSVELVVDRAAVERTLVLTTVPRARTADREPVERFREEQKVGVVVRTATEVEARAVGLGPGGGAVVVGLSRASPWRAAGIRYEDLVFQVDGVPVDHPQVLLEAIRARESGTKLKLSVTREGHVRTVEAPIGRREQELREFRIPLLYSYSRSRGRSETSVLFGLYGHESTSAAWRTRLLWLITFSGGDADALVEDGA